MAAKTYTILVGLLLVGIGLLGLLSTRVPLHRDHNLIHLVTGVVALGVAFVCAGHARTFAKIFGGIYALLAVAGLAGVHDLGPVHLALDLPAVIYIHGAIGIAGLLAGFLGKKSTTSKPTELKAAA